MVWCMPEIPEPKWRQGSEINIILGYIANSRLAWAACIPKKTKVYLRLVVLKRLVPGEYRGRQW